MLYKLPQIVQKKTKMTKFDDFLEIFTNLYKHLFLKNHALKYVVIIFSKRLKFLVVKIGFFDQKKVY